MCEGSWHFQWYNRLGKQCYLSAIWWPPVRLDCPRRNSLTPSSNYQLAAMSLDVALMNTLNSLAPFVSLIFLFSKAQSWDQHYENISLIVPPSGVGTSTYLKYQPYCCDCPPRVVYNRSCNSLLLSLFISVNPILGFKFAMSISSLVLPGWLIQMLAMNGDWLQGLKYTFYTQH